MVVLITFALCEKEGSVGVVGVVGLETADASTDGVTGALTTSNLNG